jgi:hypothetical protein
VIDMTLTIFKDSLSAPAPPAGLRRTLVALWHDAKGDWEAAHQIAQKIDDETGAWVHAYLHRKEGDLDNAAYWYRRAGKKLSQDTLDEEWDLIATALLEASGPG